MSKIKIAKEIAEVQSWLAENEGTLKELQKINREENICVSVVHGDVQKVKRGTVTDYVGRKETAVKFPQGIDVDAVIDCLISITLARIEDAYNQLDVLAEKLKNAPR